MKTTPHMNPILIGYRCCGKTSIGGLLARRLGMAFMDTDQYIEHHHNVRIDRMVAENGWAYFRQKETFALKEIAKTPRCVIATGGGIILARENREIIQRRCFAVWLAADAATIMDRLRRDEANRASRPRFSDDTLEDETRTTLALREPLYRKLAQMTIDTGSLSPEQATELIARRLEHGRI